MPGPTTESGAESPLMIAPSQLLGLAILFAACVVQLMLFVQSRRERAKAKLSVAAAGTVEQEDASEDELVPAATLSIAARVRQSMDVSALKDAVRSALGGVPLEKKRPAAQELHPGGGKGQQNQELLGQGSWGAVYKVQWEGQPLGAASRRITLPTTREHAFKLAAAFLRLQSRAGTHPNLVQVLHVEVVPPPAAAGMQGTARDGANVAYKRLRGMLLQGGSNREGGWSSCPSSAPATTRNSTDKAAPAPPQQQQQEGQGQQQGQRPAVAAEPVLAHSSSGRESESHAECVTGPVPNGSSATAAARQGAAPEADAVAAAGTEEGVHAGGPSINVSGIAGKLAAAYGSVPGYWAPGILRQGSPGLPNALTAGAAGGPSPLPHIATPGGLRGRASSLDDPHHGAPRMWSVHLRRRRGGSPQQTGPGYVSAGTSTSQLHHGLDLQQQEQGHDAVGATSHPHDGVGAAQQQHGGGSCRGGGRGRGASKQQGKLLNPLLVARAAPGATRRAIAPMELVIVTELCPLGSLANALKEGLSRAGGSCFGRGGGGAEGGFEALAEEPEPLSMAARALLALDVSRALAHLHQRGLLHGDVKLSSVLLAPAPGRSPHVEARALLADAGLTLMLDDDEARLSSQRARPQVLAMQAPEALLDGLLSPDMDIYAFGLLLWAMASGSTTLFPQTLSSPMVLHKVVVSRARPEFPADTPRLWVQLAQDCWQHNPAMRPSALEVVRRMEQLCCELTGTWDSDAL